MAVLVDAAFFHRRYKALVPDWRTHSGQYVAEQLHRWACDHTRFDATGNASYTQPSELYRVFVYDCPPFLGKKQHPISKKVIDFGKSDLASFKQAFLQRLPQLRKVALRLGHLSEINGWTVKPNAMEDLLKGKRTWADLAEDDVVLDVKQKGVDMRIGVDVASLAYKRQVDRIVLVAGDSDFVPAAKLARREGVDVVLDSMHAHISDALYEHIDGLTSMAPRLPSATKEQTAQPAKDYGVKYSADINLFSQLNVPGLLSGLYFGQPTATQSSPGGQVDLEGGDKKSNPD